MSAMPEPFVALETWFADLPTGSEAVVSSIAW